MKIREGTERNEGGSSGLRGAVVQELKKHGVKAFAVECWTLNGFPDVVGVIPPDGRFLALELKKKGGVRSKIQSRTLEEIESHGGVSETISSLSQLRQIFRRLGLSPISADGPKRLRQRSE